MCLLLPLLCGVLQNKVSHEYNPPIEAAAPPTHCSTLGSFHTRVQTSHLLPYSTTSNILQHPLKGFSRKKRAVLWGVLPASSQKRLHYWTSRVLLRTLHWLNKESILLQDSEDSLCSPAWFSRQTEPCKMCPGSSPINFLELELAVWESVG